MTRIAFVSDPHMGNYATFSGPTKAGISDRGRLCLDVLEASFYLAHKEGCEGVCVNGDLFDTSHPEAALSNAVGSVVANRPTLRKVLLPGNHDMVSTAPGNNACAVFNYIQGVYVPSSEAVIQFQDAQLFAIPFETGNPAKWLPERLASLSERGSGKPTVLSLHMGLITKKTSNMLVKHASSGAYQATHLASLCKKHKISRAFLGDWHHPDDYESKGVGLHQVGTLCPSDFRYAIPGVGRLIVWDSKDNSVTSHVIPGPRWVVADNVQEAMDKVDAVASEATKVFVRVTCDSKSAKTTQELLTSAYGDKLGGVSAIPDATATKAKLKSVAENISAAPVEKILDECIKSNSSDAGVSYDNVKNRVCGYLPGY